MIPDTTWQDDAACVGADTERFFPERGADPRPAQAVCATCPVAQQCLEHALTVGEDFGIWGGKTGRARRSILQARSGAHQTGLVGALALRGVEQRELAERLGVITHDVAKRVADDGPISLTEHKITFSHDGSVAFGDGVVGDMSKGAVQFYWPNCVADLNERWCQHVRWCDLGASDG